MRRALSLPPGVLLKEVWWRSARGATRATWEVRSRLGGVCGDEDMTPFLLAGRHRSFPRSVPDRGREACVDEAEAALEGKFDVLGLGRLDFGSPPDWGLDPVSGFSWPRERSRGEPPAPERTDVKVPWEASRMHWLVALARANAYRPDERWVRGAGDLLESWRRGNPPGVGVNWCNAMEAGIRAANLVWAAEIFDDSALSRVVGGLLRAHGRFVFANLEYSPRLTSNHYLADLVGLMYCGAALRDSLEGRAWLGFAWRSLQREVLKQFRPDGMNFEASTGYHRLSLELALHGWLVASKLGLIPGPAAAARLRAAVRTLALVTEPAGVIPSIGDDDSGIVVDLLSGRDPRDPSPLLGLGASLLGIEADDAPRPDELQEWAAGRSLALPRSRLPAVLPAAGICILENGLVWCLVDCGGVGQNGNGGHAHNDTLSFVLCVEGAEVITDPGSFTYTRDPDTRNAFRGTRAHSTVEVDGEEINRFEGSSLFTLSDDDRPVVERADLSGGPQVLVARHEGYRRLPDPLVHRRTWRLEDGVLTVEDEMVCAAHHAAVVSLPLAPGVAARPEERGFVLQAGDATVALVQRSGPPMDWEVERAEVSPRYGSAVETLVLRGRVSFEGRTAWSFSIGPVDKVGAA